MNSSFWFGGLLNKNESSNLELGFCITGYHFIILLGFPESGTLIPFRNYCYNLGYVINFFYVVLFPMLKS